MVNPYFSKFAKNRATEVFVADLLQAMMGVRMDDQDRGATFVGTIANLAVKVDRLERQSSETAKLVQALIVRLESVENGVEGIPLILDMAVANDRATDKIRSELPSERRLAEVARQAAREASEEGLKRYKREIDDATKLPPAQKGDPTYLIILGILSVVAWGFFKS